MATCNLGASSVKVSNLKLGFGETKLGTLQPLNGLRIATPVKYHGLIITERPKKASAGCKCLFKSESALTKLEDGSEEANSSGLTSELIPNSQEVECLLTQICETSSIAEFELKLGGFQLNVSRKLIEMSKPPPPPPPVSAPISMNTTVRVPDSNGSIPTSLAISKPAPSSGGIQAFLDKAADGGLAILTSPRVGHFKRSRTIKGKRAPPSCKENQIVKDGQVLCYVDQLGGELPIESDVAGEVIKILREDGDPVGYGDALMAVLPDFPGIKKLQ